MMMHKLYALLSPPRCPYCNEVQGTLPYCVWCVEILPQLTLPSVPVSREHCTLTALQEVYACYAYAMPIRRMVLRMKSKEHRAHIPFFAGIMAQHLAQLQEVPPLDLVLAPPATAAEIRKNGHYSHAAEMARSFAAQSGIPTQDGVLVKIIPTVPQKQLNAQQRKGRLLGAFAVTDTAAVQGKTILLVDDVITTGATLNECAKMLHFHGAAAVYGLCLAHRPYLSEPAPPPLPLFFRKRYKQKAFYENKTNKEKSHG